MEFQPGVITVERIYLSADECKANTLVKCMEENCEKTFSSESNLTMHLVKSHKMSHLWQKGLVREYYCPESNCIYNSNKSFKYMRYLKQHYMKVHLQKTFSCTKCNKMSFANEVGLKKHGEYCGVDFKCLDCPAFYGCYETLKTHSRRKCHKILNKCEYKPATESTNSTNSDVTSAKSGKKPKLFKNRFILPKPSAEIQKESLLCVNIDQGVQTEAEMPELRNITTQVFMEEPAPMSNSETQTFPKEISKNSLLTAETQTIDLEINEFLNVRKNVTTQTNKLLSRNQSCNTSFDFDDLDFLINTTEKNSSSTQTVDTPTNIYSTSTNTHDSIHTDTSDLLTENLNDSFDTLFNCHTETQTDLFQDDLFNGCDFSSMYTQTCDPVLYGMGFNDSETQTVLNNFLKSVESQTIVSHTKRMTDDAAKELMHHTETQTDIRFPQILEEIHS